MPIDIFAVSDGWSARQSFDSPTIYLDHWAVRLFSDDLELQDRFVNSLKLKEGTLLLSNFSLVEFSGASDPKHCVDTERFFNRLLPNIYFTDFAWDKIQERESLETGNEKRFWPPADLLTLKYFCDRLRDDSGNFTMCGFLSEHYNNRDKLLQLKDKIVCNIRISIDSCRDDPLYVKKSRNLLPSIQRTRTMIILGELMRGFNLDSNSNITNNDIIDLIHTAFPLNCCDYVLIDGPWKERVEKMNRRISRTSLNMPIAKCFSKRDKGIESFLNDLESFDKANNLVNVAIP